MRSPVPGRVPAGRCAGREIRVMVASEEVSDAQSVVLAKDIARRIEDEMTYPGQIKVNVIRETRATEYAR
jgi:ribonuclease Y